MEFFLSDPNIERLAPEKTRILDLHAELLADGRRLRVALELTPFLNRPTIEIALKDGDGNELVSTSIVEPVGWKLEVTLHIRIRPSGDGKSSLSASLVYPELGQVDRREIPIEVPVS
ncbi:MAG TPA: hypothetical protein VMC09_07960 [Anaerolineales bacterium]|nr:hypothetical protein [Anaerolineales bacterium]